MAHSFSSSLVIYADLPHLMDNNVMNRGYMSSYHGGEALTDMAEAIQLAGFEFMTIDRYQKTCQHRKALLVSNMASGLDIKNKNIIPSVCYSLESPIIASRYYHHIRTKTKSFDMVYDWAGVASRIDNYQRRFLPISWPTTVREVMVPEKWDSKKFLVMINSNKRALQWAWPAPHVCELSKHPKALLSNMRTSWIKSVDPYMKSEVYLERLRAIEYLSTEVAFDLYGGLWESDQGDLGVKIKSAIRKCYRGVIPDKKKLEVLKAYKFSIVFENTIFPGYLTEKIFDCFFASVIPIYLGDPHVSERIPSNCFVDMRKFSGYDSLTDYLLSMPMSEALSYLDATKTFMKSSAFEPFTSKYFANTIVNCLNEIDRQ
jgi:hypothetical protein